MPETIAAAPTRQAGHRARAVTLLYWLTPVALFFLLYHDSLKVWFFADDFAWLSLLRRTQDPYRLLKLVFGPEAQGTIRPWSETGFFLLFGLLFGPESLPLRIWVFLTMAADIVLLSWIALRITGSRVTGFLAPILWFANSALLASVAWNSAYNEILDAFFLLAATALFIAWDQTGRRRFWWWQLAVFVLGFGALEVNVVYPALVAGYALFAAAPEHRRRLLAGVAPLACISVLYFAVHRMLAPLPAGGPYAVHVDGRILAGLDLYWRWSLMPKAWLETKQHLFREPATLWGGTLVIALFCVREIMRRRYTVLFFVFWFLITLAPMLPIPGHRADYYLTIPLIGFAMLAASGLASVWQNRLSLGGLEVGLWPVRAAAVAVVAAWLVPMVRTTGYGIAWWIDHSRQAENLVLGVVRAHATHPNQTIVLDGVTTPLYNDVVGQSAFYPFGMDRIYLTPDAARIHPDDNPQVLGELILEPSVMMHAVTHEQVVVYSLSGDHLKNITGNWMGKSLNPKDFSAPVPHRVEAGSPLWAFLLGSEWYPLEPGFRWMPRKATVRLGGPRLPQDRLLLEGFCPEEQLKAGPLHLMVSAEGIPLKKTEIDDPETSFRRLFDIPPSLLGKPAVEVEISVDKVIHDPGGRELGLDFGTVAIGQY